MKRGYIILIAGAVLLVAGVAIAAVWGVAFAGSFIQNNTIVAKTTVNPGQSVSAKTDVTQVNRPITLTVGIDRSQQQGQQQQQQSALTTNTTITNAKLKETITDPNGQVLSNNEFGDGFVTSVTPHMAGTYTVTITNLGTQAVPIGGTFGYFPIAVGSDGKPDINAIIGGAPGQGGGLGMIIVGGVMAVVGIITLIVGGIVTVVDSRARQGTTTNTGVSEGGVTYRKD